MTRRASTRETEHRDPLERNLVHLGKRSTRRPPSGAGPAGCRSFQLKIAGVGIAAQLINAGESVVGAYQSRLSRQQHAAAHVRSTRCADHRHCRKINKEDVFGKNTM
jgi:hypothetical protein